MSDQDRRHPENELRRDNYDDGTQLDLLGPDVIDITDADDGPTLQERFDMFVEANPHVIPEAAKVARFFANRGQYVSIDRVWVELRERLVTTGDSYRLNNDFRAPAARLLMARYQDLDGYFSTRASQVDEPDQPGGITW